MPDVLVLVSSCQVAKRGWGCQWRDVSVSKRIIVFVVSHKAGQCVVLKVIQHFRKCGRIKKLFHRGVLFLKKLVYYTVSEKKPRTQGYILNMKMVDLSVQNRFCFVFILNFWNVPYCLMFEYPIVQRICLVLCSFTDFTKPLRGNHSVFVSNGQLLKSWNKFIVYNFQLINL